jgi:hypothetical protein
MGLKLARRVEVQLAYRTEGLAGEQPGALQVIGAEAAVEAEREPFEALEAPLAERLGWTGATEAERERAQLPGEAAARQAPHQPDVLDQPLELDVSQRRQRGQLRAIEDCVAQLGKRAVQRADRHGRPPRRGESVQSATMHPPLGIARRIELVWLASTLAERWDAT